MMPFAGDKSHLLAMGIAMFALFWLEAPFDWTTWCQFNPELARMPGGAPFGMSAGGPPWIAPVGYIMFCAIPVALTAWIAPKGS